jgi:S1-C subfamily serine protease
MHRNRHTAGTRRTRRDRRQAGLLVLGVAAALAAQARALPVTEQTGSGLVQVLVTFQETVPAIPWQWQEPGVRSGYGVLTGNGWILTTEDLVRNQRLVELTQPRSGRKTPAVVMRADPQLNLAVLAPAPDHRLLTGNGKPVSLGTGVDPSQPVDVLQLDATRQIQRQQARLLDVHMSGMPNAPYRILAYTALTDVNVNGQGAPVLQNGELVGLFMSYDAEARSGTIVPVSVIRRFLEDMATPPYQGVAAAGFFWSQLIDDTRRRYYGVPEPNRGVQVLLTAPDTGAAKVLKPNDIILEWDGYAIDDLGYYQDPAFGRMEFSHLISQRRRPGDRVPVTLVRDQMVTNVTVRLTKLLDEKALIPENVLAQAPDYLVSGGFVLRELTGRYLRSVPDWERKQDSRLVYLYNHSRFSPEHPGDRIVLLSRVLPDPINVGYQGFEDMIVETVNSQPVRNMDDVFRVVDQDGALYRIGLRSIGMDLVLDRETLEQANRRIQRQYRIPAMRYRHKPLPPERQDDPSEYGPGDLTGKENAE